VLHAAITPVRSTDVAVSLACPRSRADPPSVRLLSWSCGLVRCRGHFPAARVGRPGWWLVRAGQDLAGPVLHRRRPRSSQAMCGPGARVKDGDRLRRRPPRAAMPSGGSPARPPACRGGIRAVAIHGPAEKPAEYGRSRWRDLQRWVHRPRPVRARPHRQRCRPKADGASWGPSRAPAAAVSAPPSPAPATRHRSPCPAGLPGRARRGSGREGRSHEHR